MKTVSALSLVIVSLLALTQVSSARPYYGARGENSYDQHVFYDFIRGEKTTEHSISEKYQSNKHQ